MNTRRKPQALVAKTVSGTRRLLGDIRGLIESARAQTAQAVNAGLVLLYWQIGERIRRDILKGKRGEYGQKMVAALSRQLTVDYGQGFNRGNLFRMIQFAERFANPQIVATLSRQLSWSHFVEIIPHADAL